MLRKLTTVFVLFVTLGAVVKAQQTSMTSPGGGGAGSGSLTAGSAISGGTPSTLCWEDSGALFQCSATPSPTAVTSITWGTTLNQILANNASWWNFSYLGQAANGIGSATQPFLTFGPIGAGNSGIGQTTAAGIFLSRGSAITSTVIDSNSGAGITMSGTGVIGWAAAGALTAANPAGENGQDTNLGARIAAGIWGPPAGSWMQNTSGEGALNANYTNATTTFSNTNLSRTVISGRTYTFDLSLLVSQSTAVDGWKIDFNGGTAAATNFVVNCNSTAETGIIVVLANATSAALATVINATTTVTTGGQMIECHGSFVPSGAGTFIVRGGLNSVTTGTFTVKRGSTLAMRDAPAL